MMKPTAKRAGIAFLLATLGRPGLAASSEAEPGAAYPPRAPLGPPPGRWVRESELVQHAEPAQQALFGELGGPGLLYSLNYEFRFIPELGARIGLTVLPPCMFRCQVYAGGPFTMSAFINGERHHMEVGAGFTGFLVNDDVQFVEGHIGYRYEPVDGGFVFRAMITPMVRLNRRHEVIPWGGLSAGYSW
jgi:hypothetical protein